MADVKWIKITTDIFDDEKILLIESLPDAYAIITVWFKLLCLAGKMNNSGVFMMNNRVAYTDKMLATIFRMKESTVQLALQTFVQFGMVEIIDGVITIPNWNKHQSLDAYEKKKQRDRIYQAERRAAQKALVAESSDTSADYKATPSADVAVSDKDKEEDKEKDKKKTKEQKKEPKIFSDDPELNQAILSFIDFRKSIKKPMTDHAVDLLIKKLNEMSPSIEDQIEIINQSIMNGWQGVFPLKDQGRSTQSVKQPYHKQTKAEELDDFYAMAKEWSET
jgi:predicted phage replisome organizer